MVWCHDRNVCQTRQESHKLGVDSKHMSDRQYSLVSRALEIRLELHHLLDVTLSKSLNYSELKHHHVREVILDHPLSKFLFCLVIIIISPFVFFIALSHFTVEYLLFSILISSLVIYPIAGGDMYYLTSET